MTACLFIDTGVTFTFHNVTVVVDNEKFLVLDYVAKSDGRVGTVTVQKDKVVAYSFKAAE